MPKPRAPWWMYVVAASFLAYFALLTYSDFWGPERVGMNIGFGAAEVVVQAVFSDSPGERAGLKPGDRLLAVDGMVIHSRFDWDVVGANLEVGRPHRMEIERDGQARELVVTLGRTSPSKELFQSPPGDPSRWSGIPLLLWRLGPFLLLSAKLIVLVLALIIAFSRPQDLVARMGAWLLACGAFMYIALPYGSAAMLRDVPVPLAALLWIPIISTFLFPGIFLTFFAIFPRRLFSARRAWVLVWAPLAFHFSLGASYFYRVMYDPQHATPIPGGFFPILMAIVVAYVLGGLAALVMNYRRLEDINERRRVRILVTGTVVGWLGVLPTPLFYFVGGSQAAAFFSSALAPLTIVLFLAFPLSFAYAILRHRLFDIRVIIRQGLQYALARGLVVSMLPAAVALFLLDVGLHHGDIGIIAIGDFFAHSPRGWVYVVIGVLALLAHGNRHKWLDALDRRFFRERYDAQRLLREVAEEVGHAASFDGAAPRVVARIEAALHPEFAALLVREPREPNYRILASAPAGQAPPPLPTESKLVALMKLLGKPLRISLTESGWLKEQLPHEETDFLRQTRIELLVPIGTTPDRTEALLALGFKRSEEPYTQEDQDLLVAIAASLRLLVEKPAAAPMRVSETFEECPRCGICYDTGARHCAEDHATLTPVRLPRQLVGRYRLERRRGHGGMGTVYEATDTALERRVAVKVVRDDLLGSAEAAERFRREARAAASFDHPNVVTVHDFGMVAETRAFLVMELLKGSTLREELRREKRLEAPRVLEILRGVCSAVDAAHRRQLIHRDLKPENIFLARDAGEEIAKVLDFGIAKFLPAATEATSDTAATALLGTLHYMAPEQLHGEAVHASWDLWALAVVAYEMLTGAQPFAGATAAQVHSALLAGRFTPIPTHLPEAPARWQEFFTQVFAADPNQRVASARTFFSEMQRAFV